jgi:uncharacterized protein (TIGR02594 family)
MYAACPRDFTCYPWMEWAFLALGYSVKEGRDRPVIYDFFKYAPAAHPTNIVDSTSWCSAFVCYCFEQAGIQGTRRANARSWLQWGMPLGSPKFGCVTIFWRGDPEIKHESKGPGHVGFYTGFGGDKLLLLGGNQGNAVTVKEVTVPVQKNRKGQPVGGLLGYRWPKGFTRHT